MSRIEDAIQKLKDRHRDEAGAREAVPGDGRGNVIGLPRETPVAARARREPARTIAIDWQRLRDMRLVVPEDEGRRVASEFRAIKRRLLANITGRSGEVVERGNVIMVASALPGEGKTFTSLNLALSLALERDFNVVLVDADVARPHLSTVLGIDEAPGLLDVVGNDGLHLDDVEIGTDVPGLTVVSAGGRQDTAVELLSSARMAGLAAELAGHLDSIYVLDSSPLLVTNEAHALAEMVGQVALVVRAGVTPQPAVEGALEAIPDGPYVGIVLNEHAGKREAGQYGYGYGYGYGQGFGAGGRSGDGSE